MYYVTKKTITPRENIFCAIINDMQPRTFYKIQKIMFYDFVTKAKKDNFDSMTLEELKQLCVSTFGAQILYPHQLLIHLLGIDDNYKFGGSYKGEAYSHLSIEDICMECNNRKLPNSICPLALMMILRAHRERETILKSNDQLKASVAITEGFAQQHKINSTATNSQVQK